MPRIPQAQASQQLGTSGASVRPGNAGQALAQLGAAAAGIGFQAIEEKKRADDAAFVTETTNRILREETEKQADIEARGVDVDFDANNQEYQDRLSEALENAPSPEAAQEVRLQADTMYSRKFFPGYKRHQSKLNVNRRIDSVTSALDDINSEVMTGRTSVPEALARSESAIVGLAETSGGVVDIAELRRATNDSVVGTHLLTRIDNGDARGVLNEIKSGKWDSLTNTNTLAKMQNKAKQDIKQRSAIAKANYAKGLDDYIAFLSSGNDDEALSQRYSSGSVNSMFGEKGAEINEKIRDAREFGNTLNEIKTASPEEIASLMEKAAPDSPEEFRRESAQFNIITKAVLARNKSIADDPAAYVNQNSDLAAKSFIDFQEAMQSGDPDAISSSATQYVEVQKAVQEELGIPSRSVQLLSKPMEDFVATQINDLSQGGENAVNTINTYKQAFGDDWNTVQAQLAGNKKIGESAQLIAMTPEGPGQTVVAEAMATPEKELKEFIGDDAYKDIKDDSFGALDDLRNTLRVGYGDSGTRSANMVQRGVERTAMRLIAEGVTTDTDDAIDQAKELIIGDMELYDTYRVPKIDNPDLVDEGVSALRVKILNGEVPVLAPPSSEITNPEDAVSVYLRSTSLTPITNLDNTGIAFVDSKNNVLQKPNGQPLEFTWSELRGEGSESAGGLGDL